MVLNTSMIDSSIGYTQIRKSIDSSFIRKLKRKYPSLDNNDITNCIDNSILYLIDKENGDYGNHIYLQSVVDYIVKSKIPFLCYIVDRECIDLVRHKLTIKNTTDFDALSFSDELSRIPSDEDYIHNIEVLDYYYSQFNRLTKGEQSVLKYILDNDGYIGTKTELSRSMGVSYTYIKKVMKSISEKISKY